MKRSARAGSPKNPAYEYLLTNIGEAVRRLQGSKLTDQAVHDARKALKKARAALRLLRDGMAKQIYRTENVALRDAGRCLSPVRDAKSLVGALASLRERYATKLAGSGIAAQERALRDNLAAARGRLGPLHGSLEDCVQWLKDARRQAQRANLAQVDSNALRSGLNRVYRKGRRALATAKKDGTPETLHEWRKQVKYLFNAIDASSSLGNGHAKRIKKGVDRLADRLGEDHDLAVLAAHPPQVRHSAQAGEALQPLIRKRRKKLQKDAFKLGKKIYDAKPQRRTARLLKHSHTA